MKNSIHSLAAIALIAAAAITTADASSRVVTYGRAGYNVLPAPEHQTSAKGGRTSTVALAVGQPEQSPTRIMTAGRSGYIAVPNLKR